MVIWNMNAVRIVRSGVTRGVGGFISLKLPKALALLGKCNLQWSGGSFINRGSSWTLVSEKESIKDVLRELHLLSNLWQI